MASPSNRRPPGSKAGKWARRIYLSTICDTCGCANERQSHDNEPEHGGGFTRHVFTERTGLPWAVLNGPLAAAEARGWLVQTADGVRPTDTGFCFLNDVQLLFLVDDA
jgi:hypothetical protein